MKKMIIGGFPPVKNFPCHWFEEMAGAIGGSYRVVGQHMTAPSLASAVFILIALAETLGCLPLLLHVDNDPNSRDPCGRRLAVAGRCCAKSEGDPCGNSPWGSGV